MGFRPESLTRHDSAAPSKKRADYGVFLPVTGSGSLTIPVFCGIRSPPGNGPRSQRETALRQAKNGLGFA
jgi:hypothetical protein